MMKRLALALLALVLSAPAHAQAWTTSEQTATWTTSAVVGDGVDRVAEVSTATQGGDPPALSSEPAAIDEDGNYTRTQWISAIGIDRSDQGEAKFRITCNFSHFGMHDPIIAFGGASPHHHTFIGNEGTNETTTYTTLRENPASSCSGGPLNATAYWEPSLLYESETDVFVPLKPNVVSFYYTLQYANVETMYRLPRGLAFIGGVDPADRLNTVRRAEIPDDAGWHKTPRFNGWSGWQCFDPSTGGPVALDAGNTADANGSTHARQLVNNDGTDPWAGACEGLGKILVANNSAPNCWDGHNLTSPNGRDHFRYSVLQSANQNPTAYYCPDGWWQVPHFEVKSEFANGRVGLESGHAWRSKLHLSSDRMDPNPANWHPRGSTFHFDWMNGWDSVVQAIWHDKCTGTDQNGDTGEPLTCGYSTISATQRMHSDTASPDATWSNDPIITFYDYSEDADPFGDPIGAQEQHDHNGARLRARFGRR